MVYAETTVEASPEQVFEDWTSEDALTRFFAKSAQIEAEPGGTYKLCFAEDAPQGSCGNDNGRIMALQDGRMLAFTWAMPPYMPEIRPHLTSVQLRFEPAGLERTRVRLYHTGFGDSAAWREGERYFETTWPAVLQAYREDVSAR